MHKTAKKKIEAKKGIIRWFLSQSQQNDLQFKYSAMPNSPQETKEQAKAIQDFIGIGHCTVGIALKELVQEGVVIQRRDSNNNALLYSLNTDEMHKRYKDITHLQLPVETVEPMKPMEIVRKEVTQYTYEKEDPSDFWKQFFDQFFIGLTTMMVESFKFTLEEDRNSRREIFNKVIQKFQNELQEKDQKLYRITCELKKLHNTSAEPAEEQLNRYKNRVLELEKQLESANKRIKELNSKLNNQNKPNMQWVQKTMEDMGENLKVTLGDLIKKVGPEYQ